MIEKIIPGDAQEELIKAAGRLVQVWESSRHIKSAASRIFSRQELERWAPPPGKFMTHAITLGSSEMYGANRNADRFPHEQLMRKHATFETHARNYREHKNQSPKYAVGEIKQAKYDPKLQRGEIIFWTDIDKAANEFEKARKGEEQHTSMACSVDHDLCDCCGYKSKYAHDRCGHIRDTPGRYYKEFGKYAHMVNIDPTFKDESWVSRPADRIAHTLEYFMPNEKAASGQRVVRGDELALLYGAPSPWLAPLQEIAAGDMVQMDPAMKAASQWIWPFAFHGQLPDQLLSKMANHPFPARVFRSLESRNMVMPLASFDAFVNNRSVTTSLADPFVKEACSAMPSIRRIVIHRISTVPEFAEGFGRAVQEMEPSSMLCGDVVDKMMDDVRDQFSLRYEALSKRAAYNPARPIDLVKESFSDEAFGLATLYNAYLVRQKIANASLPMIDGLLSAIR